MLGVARTFSTMPRFTVQRTVLPGTLVGAVVAVGSGLCNGLTPVVDA
jgi:hypothetical protein